MIQNLIFGILFLKILFRANSVFIFVQTFQWASPEVSLISKFLAESLKANKNYQKRSCILQYSFAQKTSLILRTSTHLTLKTICSRNTDKIFPANMFLFGVRKNVCTAPFLEAQELHS